MIKKFDEFRKERFLSLPKEQQEAVVSDPVACQEFTKRITHQYESLIEEEFSWDDYTPMEEWRCVR